MRTSTLLTPLAVVSVAVCAALAVPAAASASTAPSPQPSAHARVDLPTAQKRASDAAGRWIDALTAQISQTTADTHLSDADRTKALAILNDDLDGIRQLQTDVSSATTVAQVRDDVRTAAAATRVRAVALPQVRTAAQADRATGTLLPRLQAAQQKLTAALGAHPDKSTSALTDALNDMAAQISTAQSAADGLADAALALSPDAVAADPTSSSQVHDQLKNLHAAVRAAAADARTVRAGLR